MSSFLRRSSLKVSYEAENVQRSGYLFKRGSWIKSWKIRYYVLRKDIKELQYFESSDSKSLLGSVPLLPSIIFSAALPADADGFAFAAFIISNSGEANESKHLIRFENQSQLDDWRRDIITVALSGKVPDAAPLTARTTSTGSTGSAASTLSASSYSSERSAAPVGTPLVEGWTCYGRKFYAKMAGRRAGTTVSCKSAFLPEDVYRQGYLYKQGTWIKSWKRRYFILRRDVHELHYYDDHITMRLLGMVHLDTNTVITVAPPSEVGGYSFVMRIASSVDVTRQPHLIRFNSMTELEDWSRDVATEAATVEGFVMKAGALSGEVALSRSDLEMYVRQLTEDIRVMKDEIANVNGRVVPSSTSQVNARATTIRQSTAAYQDDVQRVQEEMALLSSRYSSLGLFASQFEDSQDLKEMKSAIDKAFSQLNSEIQGLMVDRRATMANSNMTTTSFVGCVDGKSLYRFITGEGPVLQDAATAALVPTGNIRKFRMKQDMPEGLRHCTITAQWLLAESNEADDQNILGGTGKLIIMSDEKNIDIPVMDATEELLSYYRAHLLFDGDYFKFETARDYPLFMMDIGENYINEFIMKKKRGLYLEYHNEPHYHEPLNAQTRGSYCLAREVPCDDPDLADAEVPWKSFHITCFRIPLGTACYSEPYAIHDDAPTIGEWRVGYIDAENFSTVTLLNCETEQVGFNFI